jgi:hypothetical protein
MKIFPQNRRGTDKLISVYWFFILFLSAAAIVYMVAVFYGYPDDVRELEANILANNVAECISQKGILNPKLLVAENNFSQKFNDNFLQNCRLTFEVEDTWGQEIQYLATIEFFKLGNLNSPVFKISQGNLNLFSSCVVQEDEEYDKLAKCVERRFYAVGAGEQYLVKILSVVRKTEKNVKI